MADSSLASVVPRKRKDFSWISTPAVDYNRIAQQYAPDVANPNLAGAGGAPNPAIANSVQKNIDRAVDTAAANLRSAGGSGVVDAARVPGATTTPVGNLTVAGGQINRDAPVNPVTGQQSAMQAADDARALWLSRGGSEATMHQAQVAQGRRAPIDARTVHSPGEVPSDASVAAMRSFGDGGPGRDGHSPWVPTKFGNAGSAIWSQMSQNFDASRTRLRDKLNGTTTGPMMGPPAEMFQGRSIPSGSVATLTPTGDPADLD